jgi:hypothetical protein
MLLLAGSLLSSSEASGAGRWKTFVNRAEWRMSYPSNWQIESCRQCEDAANGIVLVAFAGPAPELINGGSGREQNIYVLNGKDTFAISAAADGPSFAVHRQIPAAFRFTRPAR